MTAFPAVDYYAQLVHAFSAAPNSKGEVWMACPQCHKGGRHFSFSPNGCFCFKCGFKASLRALYEQLVGGRPVQAAARPDVPPAKPRAWQRHALELALDFAQTPGTAAAWKRYKPLDDTAIRVGMLGLGVWPGGLWDSQKRQCTHRRLIVPLFSGSDVVGFRCRAFECACTKWLSPAGTRLVLYGAESIQPGRPLTILENPVDRWLVDSHWGEAAVATMGVTVWKDAYTTHLRQAAPSQVCVAYDNDASGNATDPAILAEWAAKHPNIAPPLAGFKLVKNLRAAGFDAFAFDWAGYPAGADIGSLFTC